MNVYFRVDAGPEMGTGHFMRCRLLARVLAEKGIQSSFITATPENTLMREAQDEGFSLLPLSDEEAVDASAILRATEGFDGHESILVVDDHRSDFHTIDFQETVRQDGLRLLMISFQHGNHFVADAVHNQNLLALEHDYSTEDYTDLLLGPRYAVLDEEYRRIRSDPPDINGTVNTVLITFGGADHTNQTRKVVEALSQLEAPLERVIVVVGGMYTAPETLGRLLDRLPHLNAELHINTSRMPHLMAASDLAISSGGLTAWELACLGVPNVILSTADTQRQTGQLLDQEEYAWYLGHHDDTDHQDVIHALDVLFSHPDRRLKRARRSWKLVDGHGTERVAGYIDDLLVSPSMTRSERN